MSEDNNTQNTGAQASPPLIEGYQAIKGYQLPLERGYQSTRVLTPSQPPQGGSVIARPVHLVGGAPSQGSSTLLPPMTPPQGGSVAPVVLDQNVTLPKDYPH